MMALAVTHILIPLILLDLARHYIFKKENFPRYLVVIGGLAGLAPDLDVILGWIYSLITGVSTNLHGEALHSLYWPLLLVLAAIYLHYKNQMKWASILYVIAFGLTFHAFLDCLFGGMKWFLWPIFTSSLKFCPQWGIQHHATSIDAILLVLWLVHEELHKKIKDYF